MHRAAGDCKKPLSPPGSPPLRQTFQLALPVAAWPAGGKCGAEMRDLRRASVDSFLILSPLLPTHRQPPIGGGEGGINFDSVEDNSQGFVVPPGTEVNMPGLRVCQ